MQEYKTIFEGASDEFVEKKSRFIGYIQPVTTEEEANEFIKQINKKHNDATHNCYAYVLLENQIRRFSDNGEPSGTAGAPILDVILKNDLKNVAIVVTRYYGGILLGTGGLVRAYSHGAAIAVKASEIKLMTKCSTVSIKFDYSLYGKIQNYLPLVTHKILKSDFLADISLEIMLHSSDLDDFKTKLIDMTNANISIEFICEEFDYI